MTTSAINGINAHDLLNTVRESICDEKCEAVNRIFSTLLCPEGGCTKKTHDKPAGSALFTPELVLPVREKLPPLGEMIESIGTLNNLYQDIGRSDFIQRLNIIRIEQKTRESAVSSALQEIDAELSLYQSVLEQLESQQSEWDNVLTNLTLLEAELSEVRQRLEGLTSDDPKYKVLISREAELAMLSGQAMEKIEYLQARIAVTSGMAAEYAMAIDEHLTQVETLSSRPLQNAQYVSLVIRFADNTKSLAYLMSVIQSIIQKSNEFDIKSNSELNIKLSQVLQNSLQKKVKEYEEKLENANNAARGFQIFFKVLGILGSIVAGLFCGGVVGLVMCELFAVICIVDLGLDLATGKSFIDDAVEWVMDKTLTPLITMLSKVIRDKLIEEGKSWYDAELIANILATLTVIASVIIIAFLVKKVGGKLLGRFSQTSMGQKVEYLRAANKTAYNNLFGLSSPGFEGAIRRISIQQMHSIVSIVNATLMGSVVAASETVNGLYSRKLGVMSAEVQQILISEEFTSKSLNDAAITQLKDSNNIISVIQNTMISMLENSRRTSSQILHNTSFRA